MLVPKKLINVDDEHRGTEAERHRATLEGGKREVIPLVSHSLVSPTVSVAPTFSKKVPTFLAEDSYETNEPERRWRWNWLKAEVDCGNVREKGGLLNSRTEKSRINVLPWPTRLS